MLRDVVYAEPVGFRPLSLDLYPASVPDAPVVLFVHGGGWRLGGRTTFVPTMPGGDPFVRIASAGLAVASLDYRLSGEARFPAQVDDVAAALAWVRVHATELGVAADRVVLWGESAGATLAALVALHDDPAVREGVRGVVDWYGPSDLIALATAQDALDDLTTREAGWLGHTVGADLARARDASPVSHVRAGAPPFLVAHGADDTAVPASQSVELAQALLAVGADAQLTLVPHAGHMWQGEVDREALLDSAIAFCKRVTR
ncbi:alpha/beta hydrolase [Demequina capsici]|uniref:Alpha/beta hydrolase n=1 Tax=Demequina capsici TaxID=3075620 RepID=A0AA96JBV1_9MICO|nr:alpha/beta hydrolase [Demequina sp. PMTSA13]WNM28483.1 alpha/beta hydrolase [Demequina sp. PMTSA13]